MKRCLLMCLLCLALAACAAHAETQLPTDQGAADPGAPVQPIRADWAEPTPRAVVVDEDGEYVTVMADQTVTEVRLLALTFADVDEEGNVAFDTEVLYEQDSLMAEAWIVFRLAFPGDIPPYGISLVDEAGAQRSFAIGISGMDGSLVLSEF